MAVAFNGLVSTHFDVPATQELGPSQLVVVANGILSAPVAVTGRRSQIVGEETAAISNRHRRRIERNFTPRHFAIGSGNLYGNYEEIDSKMGVSYWEIIAEKLSKAG
jgi:hypothetical protein